MKKNRKKNSLQNKSAKIWNNLHKTNELNPRSIYLQNLFLMEKSLTMMEFLFLLFAFCQTTSKMTSINILPSSIPSSWTLGHSSRATLPKRKIEKNWENMPKVEAIIRHLRTFWGYFLAVMEDVHGEVGAVLMHPITPEVILYCWVTTVGFFETSLNAILQNLSNFSDWTKIKEDNKYIFFKFQVGA